MHHDWTQLKIFATEFWPQGSHNNTHQEDDDWFGGITHGGCNRGTCGQNEAHIFSVVFDKHDGIVTNKWTEDFFVAGSHYIFKAPAPFWPEGHNNKVAEAFTKNYKTELGNEINVSGSVLLNEDKVGKHGNQNIS